MQQAGYGYTSEHRRSLVPVHNTKVEGFAALKDPGTRRRKTSTHSLVSSFVGCIEVSSSIMTLSAAPTGLSTAHECVGVTGGGAWGTSMAIHYTRTGHTVMLWDLEKEVWYLAIQHQEHALKVGTAPSKNKVQR